jgi:hypothetical protein
MKRQNFDYKQFSKIQQEIDHVVYPQIQLFFFPSIQYRFFCDLLLLNTVHWDETHSIWCVARNTFSSTNLKLSNFLILPISLTNMNDFLRCTQYLHHFLRFFFILMTNCSFIHHFFVVDIDRELKEFKELRIRDIQFSYSPEFPPALDLTGQEILVHTHTLSLFFR